MDAPEIVLLGMAGLCFGLLFLGLLGAIFGKPEPEEETLEGQSVAQLKRIADAMEKLNAKGGPDA